MSARNLEPTTPSTVNAKMFSTGQFSDMTIKCGGKEFRVHRSVVCLQSKPIHTAITHFKEGSTGIYEIFHSEPEIVHHFLKYLYTGNYSDKKDSISSSLSELPGAVNNPLVTNVKVYVLAKTYAVQPLEKLAMEKYEKALAEKWDSGPFTVSLWLLYRTTTSKESDAVPMRHVVAKSASKRISELVRYKSFNKICKENGEIPFDILQASARVGWADCTSTI